MCCESLSASEFDVRTHRGVIPIGALHCLPALVFISLPTFLQAILNTLHQGPLHLTSFGVKNWHVASL
jgi:hypothetical protein